MIVKVADKRRDDTPVKGFPGFSEEGVENVVQGRAGAIGARTDASNEGIGDGDDACGD